MVLLPDEIVRIAQDISGMRIRGAGRIAKAVAEAMLIAAQKYQGKPEEFKPYLKRVAELLLKTRPTAVSLPNAVYYILSRTDSAPPNEARDAAIKASREFLQLVEDSHRRVVEYGSRLIGDEEVIFTHCHSKAVTDTIIKASRDGKKLEVIVTETRPFLQGRITLRELSAAGIKVIHIPDSAIRVFIKEATMAFVGADAITSDGYLINKIGTSIVALAAYEAGVPFYSAAETIKFSPMSLMGSDVEIEFRDPSEITGLYSAKIAEELLGLKVEVLNPVFDLTPPNQITAYVTDLGVIPPQLSVVVVRQLLGISGIRGHAIIHED